MKSVKIIDQTVLPKTWASIVKEFSDSSLRREVWEAARYGSVLALASRIPFDACGKASLDGVQSVLREEYSEAGFSNVFVSDADPSVYGKNQVAAYMDQPFEE